MKSEDEQMIQRIMDTDTMGYACVYDSGSGKREESAICPASCPSCGTTNGMRTSSIRWPAM
jgi:hypothetical protein